MIYMKVGVNVFDMLCFLEGIYLLMLCVFENGV